MAKIIDITTQTMGASNPLTKRNTSQITHIGVHHSATAAGDQFIFENHWRNLGWRNGGYSEIILRNGDVQICYVPTTVTNGIANHNLTTYHICCVGSGSFTAEQEQSLVERIKVNMARFNVPVARVMGHNEFPGTATACPGRDMGALRGRIANTPTATETPNTGGNSAYTGDSLVDYLKSIGVDSSYKNRESLAQQHGIANYTGTGAQNTALLNAMRGSQPVQPTTQYYPAFNDPSIIDGLKSINVASDFNTRNNIAIANGITNYSGTASQNTHLLDLARQGKLVRA